MKKKNDVIYTKDLVYHRKYPELPTVVAVKALEPFRVHLTFKDGVEKEIDLESHLSGPVFEPIRNDPDYFRQVFVDGGTIAWPNEADFAPETLYYWDKPIPWMVEYEEREKKKKARQLRERRAKLRSAARGEATASAAKQRTSKATAGKKVAAKKR